MISTERSKVQKAHFPQLIKDFGCFTFSIIHSVKKYNWELTKLSAVCPNQMIQEREEGVGLVTNISYRKSINWGHLHDFCNND